MAYRLTCVAVGLLLGIGSPAEAAVHVGRPAASPYVGLGSWLDIFAGRPWSEPRYVVSRARAAGVKTLYLQTSNYSQAADIVRPGALGRFIDTAHAVGIQVVAWYLPGLVNLRFDTRRVRAALRFRSGTGEQFDGFALDIESSAVTRVSERNARLLSLVRRLRASAPPSYPLGAIIPSPVGMERHPHYWPNFPYLELAHQFDAFLPMAYFSYYAHSPWAAYRYAQHVMMLLRSRIGNDRPIIHMIGGSGGAIPATTLAGFVRAVADCAGGGISLYAFPQTSSADWSVLAGAPLGKPESPSCTE